MTNQRKSSRVNQRGPADTVTDWATWVTCDIHDLEHPLNPPGSRCVNPRPAA